MVTWNLFPEVVVVSHRGRSSPLRASRPNRIRVPSGAGWPSMLTVPQNVLTTEAVVTSPLRIRGVGSGLSAEHVVSSATVGDSEVDWPPPQAENTNVVARESMNTQPRCKPGRRNMTNSRVYEHTAIKRTTKESKYADPLTRRRAARMLKATNGMNCSGAN